MLSKLYSFTKVNRESVSAEKVNIDPRIIPKATYVNTYKNKIHLDFSSYEEAKHYLSFIRMARHRLSPKATVKETLFNLDGKYRVLLSYGDLLSLRSLIRWRAPGFDIPNRYYYKAIRANTTCYFHIFAQELAIGKKGAKRIVPKNSFTVTGKGFFSRSLVSNEIDVKKPQYLPEQKENYTSSQSASLGLQNHFPPVFRFGKHHVSAGVMFNESSVRLTDRLYIYDGGTAGRPYDHNYLTSAENYAKSKIGKILFSADKLDEFIKAIQIFPNRGKYNEVLARFKYDNSVKTFIGSDDLESRLMARHYADSLARELHRQGKCSKEHKIPVCFYTPDRPDLLFKEYTQFEYELDGIEATSIYLHKRYGYYHQNKYEFLLGLDDSTVLEALSETLTDGKTVLLALLQRGYVHIFRFLNEKETINIFNLLTSQLATRSVSLTCLTKILFHSLMSGDEKLAHLIFDKIALERVVDASSLTDSLFLAIERNQVEFVKKFLAKNSDLANAKNKEGCYALSVASYHGCAEIVDLLLRYHADKNARGDNFYDYKRNIIYVVSAPICLAAAYGHSKVVDLLLKKGAEPKLKKFGSHSPLSVAAAKGHIENVKLLLPSADDDEKDHAFIRAATGGMANVVGLLLYQVSQSARNEALNNAVKGGHKQIVDALIEYDACSKSKQKALEISHKSYGLKPELGHGTSKEVARLFDSYSQFSLFQWRHHRTLAKNMAYTLYRAGWNYKQCSQYINSMTDHLKINERGTFAALLRQIKNTYDPKPLTGPIDLIGRRP